MSTTHGRAVGKGELRESWSNPNQLVQSQPAGPGVALLDRSLLWELNSHARYIGGLIDGVQLRQKGSAHEYNSWAS